MTLRPCEPCRYRDDCLGACYLPDTSPVGSILVLSPFFEEKRAAHRAIATFCSTLCDRGYAVLHPDLFGCGNSAGDLEDASLDRWREDIDAAIVFLRERAECDSLVVVGCRLGGLLAASYCQSATVTPARLLLWNPVVSGHEYLTMAQRRRQIQDAITDADERPAQSAFEVEGQQLSESLYTGIDGLSLTALSQPANVRILQCSFNDKPRTDLEELQQAWGMENSACRCIVAEPFWNAHTPGDYTPMISAAEELLIS